MGVRVEFIAVVKWGVGVSGRENERPRENERQRGSSRMRCTESTMGYLELVPLLSQHWLDFPQGQISFCWKLGVKRRVGRVVIQEERGTSEQGKYMICQQTVGTDNCTIKWSRPLKSIPVGSRSNNHIAMGEVR